VNRRGQIAMGDDEVASFLAASRTVTCATIGRDGRPHLMPLWYVLRAGTLWAWTYAKSQKVRNLERDARCTLQVEAGATYDQLRGAMIKAVAEIHREGVLELGVEIFERYTGGPVEPEALRAQATKRVGLRFISQSTATWDHRKLVGGY
jgi:PPOX class probable F420-dependent enzyme